MDFETSFMLVSLHWCASLPYGGVVLLGLSRNTKDYEVCIFLIDVLIFGQKGVGELMNFGGTCCVGVPGLPALICQLQEC